MHLHLWVTWSCLASTLGRICSTRGNTDGTPISKWWVQWFMLCDFIITRGISRSSLHSRGTECDWLVGLVFLPVMFRL